MGKHKWLLILLVSFILSQSYYISVASSANTSSTTSDWTMFRYDPSHSGYTADKGPTDSVKPLWTYKTYAMVKSSPAVANGCVFVGSRDGYIYCLNASNGEQVWNYSTRHEVYSSPAIYNNSVYIGSDSGYVYRLDIATGTPLWKSEIGGSIRSSPTIVENRVYIGSGDRNLFCLNASDGATIWSYSTLYRVQSSPAVSDGVVYFASDDYFVYALNASTGNELWGTHTGSTVSSPSVYNGQVYIGSIDGYICCLNASTGTKIWEYQTGDSVDSSPAVAYGCVYVGSEDNSVYCLNASNGKKIWQSHTGYWVWSSPVVADGSLYVGSEDYSIYCFDAFTGAKEWSYETGSFVDSSPAIVNGNLFVGSSDGYVYAFALGDSAVDHLPSQSNNSLPWATVVFDAIACAVAAAIIFELLRFVHLNRKTKQNAEAKKISWFSRHTDAVFISAILAFSTIFFVNLGNGPLWVTDEKLYSQCAFYMFKNGDYLTPWAFGTTSMWLAKPPLVMWLISLAYQVFGVNNFASRFWSAAFGTLSLVPVFYLGKKLYNSYVGFLSALVLGMFTSFYVFARHAMTDVPFVFFLIASIYFLFLSEKEDNTKYVALGGLFFGLAFMTKQIAALLIPLIVFVYFIAVGRGVRFFFTKRFNLFWQVGFLVVSPWLIYMTLRFGPQFWQFFLVYSVVTRAISPIEGHAGGYLFYFTCLVNNENLFLVMSLPFAAGLSVFNSAIKRIKEDTLILAWMSVVLVVFTVAQTKLGSYILPAFPAFAIVISNFLYKLSKEIRPFIFCLYLTIISIAGKVLGKAKTRN